MISLYLLWWNNGLEYADRETTLLGVYTGTSVSSLTTIASNDDSPTGGTTTSKVTFAVTAGTTYQIAIDGYGGATGNIAMHLNLV